jgi:hypothetical protein
LNSNKNKSKHKSIIMILPTDDNIALYSRAQHQLPGNWFIEGDGTCGVPPESTITSQGAFVGFFVLTFILAAASGLLNFISLISRTYKGELFRHGVFRQTIIDTMASVIAPVLAATLFKQDEDIYTMHNFHVIAWVILFGFRPGAMMGVMQIFGSEEASSAAAGQMIADMMFPIVGCIVALASENGSVIPVAYGEYRTAVLAGVVLLVLHLVLLLVLYFVSVPDLSSSAYEDKYQAYTSGSGRTVVFILGILSITGSSVLLVVGSQMCGKLITFIDAMCQILQMALSAMLAIHESMK